MPAFDICSTRREGSVAIKSEVIALMVGLAASLLAGTGTKAKRRTDEGADYQPTTPLASRNEPVGPSAPRVAACTTTRAPSDGCSVPAKLFMSVAL